MEMSDAAVVLLHLLPKHQHPNQRCTSRVRELQALRFSLGKLEEKCNKNEYSYFLTKACESKSYNAGYWEPCSGSQRVYSLAGDKVIGHKMKYRFYHRSPFTQAAHATGWYLTEYSLDAAFRAENRIPPSTDDYVICMVQYQC